MTPTDNRPGRRDFLKAVGATAAAAAGARFAVSASSPAADSAAAPAAKGAAETAVKALYNTLTAEQKKAVCFEWDHQDPKRGLLRSHVSNNWHITKPTVDSDFFNATQKGIVEDIFKGLFHPDWHEKIKKQLKDDTGGKPFGAAQNFAIFGKPGDAKCEFVMTGRHMTIRADGHCQDHIALGGPIFHGHAASGFHEKVGHPGNVFWHQALLANEVYKMLDGKQRKLALIEKCPEEHLVKFQGPEGKFSGIPVAELSKDQKEQMEKVLTSLVEPYRLEDRAEILSCLKKQGGLDKCRLAFYQEGDIGNDGIWDNWRLEGPSFVWYWRGEPHAHIWIHVSDDPSIPLNSQNL